MEGVTVGTPVTKKQPCVKVRKMYNLNSTETKLSYFLMDIIVTLLFYSLQFIILFY